MSGSQYGTRAAAADDGPARAAGVSRSVSRDMARLYAVLPLFGIGLHTAAEWSDLAVPDAQRALEHLERRRLVERASVFEGGRRVARWSRVVPR